MEWTHKKHSRKPSIMTRLRDIDREKVTFERRGKTDPRRNFAKAQQIDQMGKYHGM